MAAFKFVGGSRDGMMIELDGGVFYQTPEGEVYRRHKYYHYKSGKEIDEFRLIRKSWTDKSTAPEV